MPKDALINMTTLNIIYLLLFVFSLGYDICLTYRFRKLRREFAIVEQIMVPFLAWIKEVQQANEKYAEEATKNDS